MYKGEFVGIEFKKQPRKILILGESHHWCKEDAQKTAVEKEKIEAEYRTYKIIWDYLQTNGQNASYHFFDKIVESFGVSKDNRVEFWNKVCFGNYVDVLCGVGDEAAKQKIAKKRKEYNSALFQFIKDNDIDIVFCFSRRAYNALPSWCDKDEDKGTVASDIWVKGKRDYIALCSYKPNREHKHTDVLLSKEVKVYGLRHPSCRGGYIPSNYKTVLSKVFDEISQ